MGIYHQCIFPRILNWAMNSNEFKDLRRNFLEPVSGVVAEIGFGTGFNLPFYASKVEKLYAIEPSEGMIKLVDKKIRLSPFSVEILHSKAEDMTLSSESVDSSVSTWTLCSVVLSHPLVTSFQGGILT
jgi:ubiquinone/menaquinone biosynthesis C-methylase UbiE